jgi:hypothetical protein
MILFGKTKSLRQGLQWNAALSEANDHIFPVESILQF